MLGSCVPAHRSTARERSYLNGSIVLNLGRSGDICMNLQRNGNYPGIQSHSRTHYRRSYTDYKWHEDDTQTQNKINQNKKHKPKT